MEIPEILQRLGVSYREYGTHHHVSHGWIGIDCPLCSHRSGKFRLGINLRGGYCNCWACGPQKLVYVLTEASGEPLSVVRDLTGRLVRYSRAPLKVRGRLRLPVGLGPLLPAHRGYLRKRGFNPDTLARMWGLQGIGLAARYAWRLFIPVFQYGQIVTWTTRTISDIPKIRYVSADRSDEAISRTRVLLGEDYCRHAIIVCEGPFDVFRIGPGAVATLGVSYSRAQVARMSKYPVRVVCFDNDTAGQERAQRLCSDLAPFPGKTVRITLDAKDAASANEREVSMIRSFLE